MAVAMTSVALKANSVDFRVTCSAVDEIVPELGGESDSRYVLLRLSKEVTR